MINPQSPYEGWNLFARVLQDLLATRNLGLGHLDDRAHVHPEKVRRLQRSLMVPKSFPMLNTQEMEEVITAFKLSWREQIRLRAAVLATSIEATLMDRINAYDALRAAEQIFPIIEKALLDHVQDRAGMGAVRGGPSKMPSNEDTEIDRKLGDALTAIDAATMALYMSLNALSPNEQEEHAKQARDRFEAALVHLNRADPVLRASDAWRLWHTEAQNGLAAAKEQLELPD